jgi:hypothetical protein
MKFSGIARRRAASVAVAAALGVLAIGLLAGHADAQRRVRGAFSGRGAPPRATARADVTGTPASIQRAAAAQSTPGFRPGVGHVNRGNVDRGVVRAGDVSVAGGDWDDRYDGCCYYGPVRRAGAVGYAAGTVAAAAAGTAVYELPSSCVTRVVNGTTYRQCGDTWYRPQFSGTNTSYVVVNPP